MQNRQVLSLQVKDQPGVLQRVCALMSRRGFNIGSITVGQSERAGISRMTIVTEGDEAITSQMIHQFDKLIDVVSIRHLNKGACVQRELALIKLQHVKEEKGQQLAALLERFGGQLVECGDKMHVVQAVGEQEVMDQLIESLAFFGIEEVTRTGCTALGLQETARL